LLELADIRLLISFQFRSEHIRKVDRHAIHLARRENFRHATRDGKGERRAKWDVRASEKASGLASEWMECVEKLEAAALRYSRPEGRARTRSKAPPATRNQRTGPIALVRIVISRER